MSRILIIDDEETLRQIIHSALEVEGHEIIEAENGKAGLALAKTQHPDLILCDVHMPEMNGYSFVEHLRKDNATAAIPLILITGVMKDYSNVRHAMGIGADDYLLKPFSIEDLLAAVDTRLKKAATFQQKAESKLTELRTNIALSLPHELRTPLVAILGYADLLKEYYKDMEREEIGMMAKDIHKSAKRLHGLIENFLIYAQIELMGTDERRIQAMRRDQTTDIHKIVRILATQKAEEWLRLDDLVLDVQEGSASISIDYFTKVTMGLLDNAFKFSETGRKVSVHCHSEQGLFTLVIGDQGRGMTAEQVQKVGGYMQFERKMYEQQGSGLGLVIAKRLTELHGGTISIESKLDEGTTVTVKLPRP